MGYSAQGKHCSHAKLQEHYQYRANKSQSCLLRRLQRSSSAIQVMEQARSSKKVPELRRKVILRHASIKFSCYICQVVHQPLPPCQYGALTRQTFLLASPVRKLALLLCTVSPPSPAPFNPHLATAITSCSSCNNLQRHLSPWITFPHAHVSSSAETLNLALHRAFALHLEHEDSYVQTSMSYSTDYILCHICCSTLLLRTQSSLYVQNFPRTPPGLWRTAAAYPTSDGPTPIDSESDTAPIGPTAGREGQVETLSQADPRSPRTCGSVLTTGCRRGGR